MNPGLGMTALHGVESCLVETMVTTALTSKVELGMFLALPLLNGALDREGQLHIDTLHVRLDLVQMFLTKVLDSVSHGEWFKHTDSVLAIVVVTRRHSGVVIG